MTMTTAQDAAARTLGTNVWAEMKTQGLTIDELCDQAGIGRNRRMELIEGGDVTVTELVRASLVLGTTVSALLAGTEMGRSDTQADAPELV